MLTAMARAAEMGGAVGIRCDRLRCVGKISANVGIPVIGIHKVDFPGFDVRITPTWDTAHDIARGNSVKVIAIDGTGRPRPNGEKTEEIIRLIHTELKRLVMADIATLEEGIQAAKWGADAVATTLSGYTKDTMVDGKTPKEPDLDLVEKLAKAVDVPVVAEGRYWTADQIAEAFKRGAHAVVVGTALTRLDLMVQKIVDTIDPHLPKR